MISPTAAPRAAAPAGGGYTGTAGRTNKQETREEGMCARERERAIGRGTHSTEEHQGQGGDDREMISAFISAEMRFQLYFSTGPPVGRVKKEILSPLRLLGLRKLLSD